MQDKVDILILTSDGGLYKDMDAERKAFIIENIKVPVGASDTFMAPFALMTYAKLGVEQGEWAAATAIKILDGASPDSIPLTKNEKGKFFINVKIAEKLGAEIPFEIVQNATVLE